MPKIINLEEMNKLIGKVQSSLLTSNNIVSRIEHPYYWGHASIPESLVQFKKLLEVYRKKCSDLIAELDKQALFKYFLSPAADFNDLSNGSFFHSIVLHLIVSEFRIGDCGECSTRLAIELAKAGYGDLAFVSIKFTAAKKGMETHHQFIVANLPKAPVCPLDEKFSVEQFFSSLPNNAIVSDAFIGLCFAPQHIAEAFKSYIKAYGGTAVIASFRHFYNLAPKSFNGYLEVASQIKTILESKQVLPALGRFSVPESWKVGTQNNLDTKCNDAKSDTRSAEDCKAPPMHNIPEAMTLPISSLQSRDYLSQLDSVLGCAAGKKIVQIDEKATTVSFPFFWLRQLGDGAIKELASELKITSNMLRPN